MNRTLTVEQILAARPILERLHQSELSIPVGFMLARLIEQLRPELRSAEEAQIKVFEKFGKRDGDKLVVPDAKMKAFHAALRPVLDIAVEVTFTPIQLSAFTAKDQSILAQCLASANEPASPKLIPEKAHPSEAAATAVVTPAQLMPLIPFLAE